MTINAHLASLDTATKTSPNAFTVAEVIGRIRRFIEAQFPAPIWIEGELSNCSFPASGHIYFDLKDEHATDRRGQPLMLPCAFFRGANASLKFKLTNGLKVLCFGQITTYEAKGQYQLQVVRVEPKGIGALQLAFEQLKKRLQAEGLFEAARKRPLPIMSERVGVITSRSGSAIHDMVSKLLGWFHVIILPVKVQGEGASTEIAQALDIANRCHLADVLIVGRGGGSVEDLWAFNEEPVARAIARSRIPVISAVGHQDDWSIADYVADHRASTPTDAAKLLVQDKETRVTQLRELLEQLIDTMHTSLGETSDRLDRVVAQLRLLHPVNQLERLLARARELDAHAVQSTRFALHRLTQQVQGMAGQLEALSPLAVLARGYSITRTWPHGRVVKAASEVQAGDTLETLLARGRIQSTVSEIFA